MMHFLAICEGIIGVLMFLLVLIGFPFFFITRLASLYERGNGKIMFAILIAIPFSFYFIGFGAIIIWLGVSFIFGIERVYRKGFIKATAILAILVPVVIAYEIYAMEHPSDLTGKRTFEHNFGVPFPATGVFISKQTSIPHPQGDYDEQFVFQVSPKEYDQVKHKFVGRLYSDTIVLADYFRFDDTTVIDNYLPVLKDKKAKEIISYHCVSLGPEESAVLYFLNDKKIIIFTALKV